MVESAGGRVDERSEQAAAGDDGFGGAAVDLVVRVPADALTGVLADLEDLGDVENVSVSHFDVTAKAVDMDARISALQTSVARLQALMDGAATTEDLLTAEKALSERQEKLESMQSQRALLADQVELSTLTVHLRPFGVAPAGGPEGFVDGLGTGWRALVTVLGAAVVVLGVLLPWMGVALLVAAAVLVPLRVMRRRAAAEAPVPPQG
jgi:Flp pilus assembly protein TadB